MSDDATVRAGPPGATVRQQLDQTSRLDAVVLGDTGTGDPPPADGTAQLVAVRGPSVGTRYPVAADTVTIGRNPGSDIRLDHVTVSRRHAEVHRTGGRFSVADLGSLNGTYVNQERVESATLEDGDELQIGKFRLVFRAAR
ncbi:FHA domain-containing protein [Actinocatenispora rupis]|uniref:Phosphopeptide-binding protein n=1 Tax=Actinocatenispora rupis TaxID=519421 RepID=A0A8J3JH95_9ACTN|nr:FHA domain-containing protein [Actinocatenispora rupis]GID15838.1 phosphopeptide-binding protein [Actinocatenispora rupis]